MPVTELKAFLGVNLRRERLKLEDFDLARAINADLSLAIGTIRIRKGRRKQFAVALADLYVRQLFRIAARRYRVADYGIYRNQTKVFDGLSRNERTTIIPFRPLLDSATWAFFADDAAMRKDDGTNLYRWGIVAPDGSPDVALGIGSGLDGSYSYRYTYCRFDGTKVAHESNPSEVSDGLLAADRDIGVGSLTHPPDPQVSHVGIYRTVDTGADHFLEARVAIPDENRWSITHLFEVTALSTSDLALEFSRTIASASGSADGSAQGPNFPGTVINNTAFGTANWNNVGNVKTSNNVYAERKTGAGLHKISNYLKATNFGFAIPTGATINGIVVEIERKKSGSGSVTDERVQIIKGGTVGSTDKADTAEWPTADTYKSYGANDDLWGETWTAADINAADFGVVLAVELQGGSTTVRALVDAIRITVYIAGAPAETSTLQGTHSWEPTSGENSSEPTGRRATHRWEIDAGYVTVQSLSWAFNSQKSDLELGSQVELDNDPPPNANFAVSHQEHLFLLGDKDNPHYLYWPKRFRPESFPPLNFIEVGNPHDPLQAGVSVGGLLGVFTRQTKYRILGSSSSGFVHQEALSKRGTRSPYSVNGNEKGVMFVSDDGVFQTAMVGEDTKLSQEIEPLFLGEAVNDYLPINLGHAAQIRTAFFRNRLFMAYPSGTSGSNDMLAIYSLDTGKWYFWSVPVASLYVEEDGTLTAGGHDGFAYDLEDGKSDAGEDITLEIETKDIIGDSQNVRKIFRTFRVDADTDSGTMTVEVLVDGDSLGSFEITGNREKAIKRIAGAFGYSARLKITYSGKGSPAIYGCLFEYENMRPAP